MHRLFGKAKPAGSAAAAAAPEPTLGQATESLNSRSSALDQKIAGLEAELRKLKETMSKTKGAAHEAAKRRALETLKRKKMYETQRDQLAGQAFNLDQTVFALETIKDTHTTVAAMKQAALTMKVEHKKINLSEIEDLQDDLEDMMEDINDISETLGRSYGVPDGIDDADLEAELAGLEDELEGESIGLDSSTPAFLQPSSLPSQPTGSLNQTNHHTQMVGAEHKADEHSLVA